MKKTSILLQALTVILILSVIAACGSKADTNSNTGNNSNPTGSNSLAENTSKSNKDKTLFIGISIPPVAFNPLANGDTASTYVQGFIFDSLLVMDGPLNFVPKLATSIDTEDNQTFTIHLDNNATWSDGTPLTADDVIFTLNRAADPLVNSVYGAYVSLLEGVENTGKLPEGQSEIPSLQKVDNYTVTLKTKQPVDPNLVKEQIGSKILILPKHVLEGIAKDQLAQDPFMLNPTVTSGAFKFVKYEKDQYIQLAANDSYYKGTPKIGNIYIKTLTVPNLVAQLQSGEIQMTSGGSTAKIPVQDYETLNDSPDLNTSIESTLNFQTVLLNQEKLNKVELRQAIAYGIDRKYIVDELLAGNGEIVNSPYTPLHAYHSDNVKSYDYDPEKSKQLFEEAGWNFNDTLQLVVPTGNQIREQVGNIIVENLRQIGVKVQISTFDFATVMQKAKAGEYDLLLMGFTFTMDPDYTSLYGSNEPYNFMKYQSEENDRLLLEGKKEADPAKRKVIYDQLQALWQEDLPLITLYSDPDFTPVSKKVIYGGPKVFGTFADLQNWDIEE
ncbi:peptide ABC transporter substrate-binding protein [Paenibacillus antibioticophila]|uniref:Peptide ABC transporter substrate-binding protein n=1 Tax=Paenibacillus antibioticophila TaxID=1274374 RepID=A0A919XXF0_9BACL|nr:ABC transporter substrate-binding protein [Paenibacillus antibioticophila]GIO38655.1 peptide ABC transporter substrate-binding protein [Paenibacillus antibioticophila]